MLFEGAITVVEMEPDELTLHKVVYMFPELSSDRFEELVNSIQSQGQLDPVWINRKNQIIDGRHRWRACKVLQRPVLCRRLERPEVTTTIIEHVIAQNVARRQLESGQRAIIAASLENKWNEALRRQEMGSPVDGEGADFPWSSFEELCLKMKTDKQSVARAHEIKKKAEPEFVRAIEDGVLKITPSYEAMSGKHPLSRDDQLEVLQADKPPKALQKKLLKKTVASSHKPIQFSEADFSLGHLYGFERDHRFLFYHEFTRNEAKKLFALFEKTRNIITEVEDYVTNQLTQAKAHSTDG